MKNIFVILLVLGFTNYLVQKKRMMGCFCWLYLQVVENPSEKLSPNPPTGSQVEQVDDTTSVIHLPAAPDAPPEESVSTTVNTENQDVLGTTDFTFQTSNTVPISIEVSDDAGPVQGAVVTILDPADTVNPEYPLSTNNRCYWNSFRIDYC